MRRHVGIGIRDRIARGGHAVDHNALQDVVRGHGVGRFEFLRLAHSQGLDGPLVIGHFVNDLDIGERHVTLVRHADGVGDHFVQADGLAVLVGGLDHFQRRVDGFRINDFIVIVLNGFIRLIRISRFSRSDVLDGTLQDIVRSHHILGLQLLAGFANTQFVNDPLVAGQIVHHFNRLQRHVTDVLHRDRVGDRVAHLHVLGHISGLDHFEGRLDFLSLNRLVVIILHGFAVGIVGVLGGCSSDVLDLMGQQVSFLDNVGSSQLVAGFANTQFVDDPLVAGQIVHHFDRLQRHVTDVLHRDRVGDRVAHLHVLGHISGLDHFEGRLDFLSLNRLVVIILHGFAVGIVGVLGGCSSDVLDLMGQQVSFLDNVGSSQLVAGGTHGQFVNDPLVAGQIVNHFDRLQRHVTNVLHRDRVGDRVAHLHVLGHISGLDHFEGRLDFLSLNRLVVIILHGFAVGIVGVLGGCSSDVLDLMGQQVSFLDNVGSSQLVAGGTHGQFVNDPLVAGQIVRHYDVLQRHVADVLHRNRVGDGVAYLHVLVHIGGLRHDQLGIYFLGLNPFGSFGVGLFTLGAGAFGLDGIHILACQQVRLGDGVLGGEINALALGQQVDGLAQVGLIVVHRHVQQVHVTGVLHHDGVGHHIADLQTILNVSGLGHADLGHFGLVEDVIVSHRSGVTVHRLLNDGVLDCLTISILFQAVEGVLPAVLSGHGLARHLSGAVHHHHGNGSGTDLLLVVQVVPGLLAGDTGLVGLVGVDQFHGGFSLGLVPGQRLAGGLVASHLDLVDDVHNLLALAVLGQIGEGVLPVIGLSQGHSSRFVAAIHDLHNDALRTDLVLVVRVVPGLGNSDLNGLDVMGVLDVVAFVVRGVVSHSHFGDLVGDLLTLGIHRQVIEGVLPVVRGGHGLAGDQLELVLALHDQQVHGDALRTLAILVVGVVPSLHTGDAGGLRSMSVDQVEAIRLGGVAFHSFLGDGVDDLLAHLALAVLG